MPTNSLQQSPETVTLLNILSKYPHIYAPEILNSPQIAIYLSSNKRFHKLRAKTDMNSFFYKRFYHYRVNGQEVAC